MREYIVERTSIESQWVFERMLPSLPGPGTTAFATLVRDLHPFGLKPSEVIVDTPTTRLGDVAIILTLLDRRLTVRITAAGFEVNVQGLAFGDEEPIAGIAEAILKAVKAIDADAERGLVKVRTSSHLTIKPDVKAFLDQHLVSGADAAELRPDVVIYRVESEQLAGNDVRAVIAQSLVYPSAIFLDLNLNYSAPVALLDLVSRVGQDFDFIMSLLGLSESESNDD